MMMLMVICCLVGAMAGLRFNILSFVSVLCVALAIVAIGEIARGDGLWRLVLAMIITSTSVQLGYLGALAILLIKDGEVSPSHNTVPSPTTVNRDI